MPDTSSVRECRFAVLKTAISRLDYFQEAGNANAASKSGVGGWAVSMKPLFADNMFKLLDAWLG